MEKKKIMKKKFLSVLLIVAVLIGMAGVSGTQTESGEQKADKEQKQQENEQTAETKVEIPLENEEEQKGWIGVILNGDETEAYTLAHIDGIRAAAENVSLPEQDIIWKERVGANDGCKSAVKDLIRQGCEIIIANSAIYEEAIKSEAEKNPEVDFVVINDSKTQSTVAGVAELPMNCLNQTYSDTKFRKNVILCRAVIRNFPFVISRINFFCFFSIYTARFSIQF